MEKLILLCILLTILTRAIFTQERCRDYLGKNQCAFLEKHGTCFSHEQRMRLLCRKTCKFCTGEDLCKDYFCDWNKKCVIENGIPVCKCHKGFCKKAKNTGEVCTISGKTFPSLCDLLYEECETGITMHVRHYGNCQMTEKCADSPRELKFGLCKSWKKAGFCERVTDVMKKYCTRTCDLCTCTDLEFCKHFQGECGQGTNRAFMKKNCPNSCHYCSTTVGVAKIVT